MRCNNCKKEIDEGLKFCPYCGTKVKVKKAKVNIQEEPKKETVNVEEVKNESPSLNESINLENTINLDNINTDYNNVYKYNDRHSKNSNKTGVLIAVIAIVGLILVLIIKGLPNNSINNQQQKGISINGTIVNVELDQNDNYIFNCSFPTQLGMWNVKLSYSKEGEITSLDVLPCEGYLLDSKIISQIENSNLYHSFQDETINVLNGDSELSDAIYKCIEDCDNYLLKMNNQSVDKVPSYIEVNTEITLKVVASNLKVRNYPSTLFGTKMTKVSKGDILTAYETTRNEGFTWYNIGGDNWVADDGTFLEILSGNSSDGFNSSYTKTRLLIVRNKNTSLYHVDNSGAYTNSNFVVNEGDVFAVIGETIVGGRTFYKIYDDTWIEQIKCDEIVVDTEFNDPDDGVFTVRFNGQVSTHKDASSSSGKLGTEIYPGDVRRVMDIKYYEDFWWYKIGSKEWIRNHGNTFTVID